MAIDKKHIVRVLNNQWNQVLKPYKDLCNELEMRVNNDIANSPEMVALTKMHQDIYDYLVEQGAIDSSKVLDYTKINYSAREALYAAKDKLRTAIFSKYALPYEVQRNNVDDAIKAINELYRNIIQTVNELTPTKAQQYVMELQLNIPATAFIKESKPKVLPDDPLLTLVRQSLQAQIGGPTNE